MYSKDKTVATHAFIKERDYWLNKLSGDLPKTCFSYDYEKPHSNKTEWEALKFRFSEENFLKLKSLSKESDHTLHIILLAGLVVLLYKYTHLDNIIIGTPIYTQDIDGEFINTVLALRNQVEGRKKFKEILIHVKETMLEAIENQNYPIEILLTQLGMEMNGVGEDFPLFDIVLLLENIQDKRYIQHIKTNMVFSFLRTDGVLEGVVEYNHSLYKKTTIERIIQHMMNLFGRALFNLDANVSDITLLTEEEKRQILFDFNNTKKEIVKDKCYHQLFEEQVDKTQDRIAAVSNDQQISYNELDSEANRLAWALLERGVTSNSIIVLYLKRSITMLASIIGVFKAGGAYLPVETDYPQGRVEYIIENSEVNIVITDNVTRETANRMKTSLTRLQEILCPENENRWGTAVQNSVHVNRPGKKGCPDDLAYMIYTSGTTGKPKGVMIHQLGMLNNLDAKINDLSLTPDDVVAQTASACFDISVWQFLTNLLVGGIIFIIDKEVVLDQQRFFQILRKGRVTILESVPSLITVFLETVTRESDKTLKDLRWMLPTGEPLTPRLVREWFRHYPGIKLINAYGPAEASDDVAYYIIDESFPETRSTVPIGIPLQNIHIYILDKDLSLCPVGVKGEICVAGIGVGKGYWKDIERTRRSFIRNPYLDEIGDMDFANLYRTGDIGYFNADGTIECLGRLDFQVKIRGNRIELGEIDRQLLKRDEIKEALVIMKEGKNRDKFLCAYIVSPLSGELEVAELKDHLKRELPDYMVPSYFVQLERFPITLNGKVDRKALPEPEMKLDDAYTAPRNQVERKLVEIWAEVLAIEKDIIGIDSNFFQLGGHSLKATVLVSRVHKELNVKVPLAEVFRAPTIKGLFETIKGLTEDRFESIEPAEKKEYYVLSSVQKRLYIVQHMDMDNIAYSMPYIVALGDEVDNGRLEETFRKLIDRHESLRTSFEMIDDEPVQKVNDSEDVDFEIEFYDMGEQDSGDSSLLSSNPGGAPVKVEIETITRNFIRPFDLSQAPLLRVGLIKTDDHKYILMVDMHHIISDGASEDILVKEFMAIYAGEELPPLTLQFKDYAEWQNSHHVQMAIKKQEEYWLKEFEGEIPALNMPIDFDRPPVQSFEGSSLSFGIEKKVTERLRKLAVKEDATLYMVMFAIYNVLLSKLSGQEEIIVGIVIAGRQHADLQHIIGMFVNTLAVRNFPEKEKTFRTFLREVKEKVLFVYENQDYQFENLVEKVALNSNRSRNPLFDTVFNSGNTEIEPGDFEQVELPELSAEGYGYENRATKFDIAFFCNEGVEELLFTMDYCTKLFKKETLERFIGYFKEIVSHVIENSDIKLKDITISHNLLSAKSTNPTMELGF